MHHRMELDTRASAAAKSGVPFPARTGEPSPSRAGKSSVKRYGTMRHASAIVLAFVLLLVACGSSGGGGGGGGGSNPTTTTTLKRGTGDVPFREPTVTRTAFKVGAIQRVPLAKIMGAGGGGTGSLTFGEPIYRSRSASGASPSAEIMPTRTSVAAYTPSGLFPPTVEDCYALVGGPACCDIVGADPGLAQTYYGPLIQTGNIVGCDNFGTMLLQVDIDRFFSHLVHSTTKTFTYVEVVFPATTWGQCNTYWVANFYASNALAWATPLPIWTPDPVGGGYFMALPSPGGPWWSNAVQLPCTT